MFCGMYKERGSAETQMTNSSDGSPSKKRIDLSLNRGRSDTQNFNDPNALLNFDPSKNLKRHENDRAKENRDAVNLQDSAEPNDCRKDSDNERRGSRNEHYRRGPNSYFSGCDEDPSSIHKNRTTSSYNDRSARKNKADPDRNSLTSPGDNDLRNKRGSDEISNNDNGDDFPNDGSHEGNVDTGQFAHLPTEDEVEAEANAPCPWPMSVFKVARCERPKFFRMAGMFFLIAYVYSVLRDTKDAVVMERQEPASIAFLKTLYVTPLSFCAVFAVSKLLGTHSVGTVLKGATALFGAYFVGYAAILLPLQERLEPSVFWAKGMFGDGKMAVRGLQPVLALFLTVNFWTSSLLYVTSELWGNLVLALLFMAFANDVCAFRQSLRFVPLFYVVSNLGLFLSGCSMLALCRFQATASFAARRLAINAIFAAGGAACAGILALHRSLDAVLAVPVVRPSAVSRRKTPRRKVGLAEGLGAMARSPLLLRACGVVLCYNACTNVVDTAFKSAMKAHAVAENEAVAAAVMRTQAINQVAISAAVIGLLLTPFARAVQIVGWRCAGLITPVWTALCGCFVLTLAAYNTATAGSNQLALANAALRRSPDLLWAERIVGMIAAGGLKTAKYAAFDIALEALSMRIARHDRPTAKGIYAGICGKLGKTFGSILTITVLGLTNAIDIRSAGQYCLVALALMVVFWTYCVRFLANAYDESVRSGQEIELGMTKQVEKEKKAEGSPQKEHTVTIKS